MTTTRSLCALAVLATSLLAPAFAATRGEPPPVRTEQGLLQGRTVEGVRAFLGVPYAAPPVGALRWRPPAPPAVWSGVREAGEFGASCAQEAPHRWGPFTDEFLDVGTIGEDCLTLNVWTPGGKQTGKARRPVLVWIHGGGFGSGSTSVPIYDGRRLAGQGVVVVSLNYRLGIFGFLAHPALSAESEHRVSGNYGLLDMVAGLQWVRHNIARFGGDPDNVTIAGQSAGAAAVQDLMASPGAAGLFRKTIAMSGAGMGVEPRPLTESEAQGKALLEAAGIGSIEQLRALPVDRVLALKTELEPVAGGMPRILFAPNRDGEVLPVNPETATEPFVSNVPVLAGYTADEGFIGVPRDVTPEAFERHVRGRYGDFAERFLAAYPHADGAQATRSLQTIGRDRMMASLVLWGHARTATGQRVYGYFFRHPLPGPDREKFGAFHTAEIPYLFGVLDLGGRPFKAADTRTSRRLQRHVLSFLRSTRPSTEVDRRWPALRADVLSVMALDETDGLIEAVSTRERFDLFRAYVKAGGRLSMF